jgi:hypothetical protein
MLKNRRAESQARALLSRAEHLAARASAQLLGGEALAAMRLLRAADQLNQLDSRLRAKRAAEIRERAAAEDATLRQRERDCERREYILSLSEQELGEQRERLKQTEATLRAAYELMRAGEIDNDGPAPATGDETDSGVAPL